MLKYNRGLMMSILHDKAHIADAVNATVIGLDDAPRGYQEFDRGAATKYVLNPHGLIPRGLTGNAPTEPCCLATTPAEGRARWPTRR